MTERVKTGFAKYFKANGTIIIASIALFWNISYQGGGMVVRKVGGVLDSVSLNSVRYRQVTSDLATFKQDKDLKDKQQDKEIDKLKSN